MLLPSEQYCKRQKAERIVARVEVIVGVASRRHRVLIALATAIFQLWKLLFVTVVSVVFSRRKKSKRTYLLSQLFSYQYFTFNYSLLAN